MLGLRVRAVLGALSVSVGVLTSLALESLLVAKQVPMENVGEALLWCPLSGQLNLHVGPLINTCQTSASPPTTHSCIQNQLEHLMHTNRIW
jgi:hypothetical protein